MSAIISDCGKYRYRLERQLKGQWEPWNNDVIAYFGINPSTADAEIDDQTVKKWMGFTCINGGSRFIAGNVFAYRSTDVKMLGKVEDPIGPENAHHLRAIIDEADILVPCWGDSSKLPKHLRHHLDRMILMLTCSGKPVMCFGYTNNGDPLHPQMLSYQTDLVRIL